MTARWSALAWALLSSVALAAPPDGGLGQLQARVAGKTIGTQGAAIEIARPGTDISALVQQALSTPLTADAAVRVALRNNPDLQATLGALGLSITDAVGPETPAKARAQQAITVLSAQTFKAWVNAVAMAQAAQFARDTKATAEASGELMRRMVQVGNASKLAQAQSQLALFNAALALVRAEQTAFAARETLTVLLGLWGTQTQFTLPPALPALPTQPLGLPDVESRALQARADLQVDRLQWQRKQQSTVPDSADALWDAMGDAATVRAQAVLLRSQARSSYFRYRSQWDIAHHLQAEVVPLRNFMHDEQVLRYNGMLTSVFELLADSQAKGAALNASVAAQRDFWWAHADLQALLAGAPLAALAMDAGGNTDTPAAASSPGGH
jgi:outer membrane protein, multidrug efflux system